MAGADRATAAHRPAPTAERGDRRLQRGLPHSHAIFMPCRCRPAGDGRVLRQSGKHAEGARQPSFHRNAAGATARPYGDDAERGDAAQFLARPRAGPRSRQGRLSARPLHHDGADRRRQDARLAFLRAGARREARAAPRHLRHPLHFDHRANGGGFPQGAGDDRRRAGASCKFRLGGDDAEGG